MTSPLNPTAPTGPAAVNPVASAKEGQWRGRTTHQCKISPLSTVCQSVIAAILCLVGLTLLSSRPILGGLSLLAGGYILQDLIFKWLRPCQLQEALKYLSGKKNLDELPEMPWSIKLPEKSSWSFIKNELNPFAYHDMTHNVMALKKEGKTIAVAIKYMQTSNSTGTLQKAVSVFSIKHLFEPCNKSVKEDNFHVSDELTAERAKVIEKSLKG